MPAHDGLADVLVGRDRLGVEGLAAELAAAGPDPRAAEILGGVVRRSTEQPDDMALCVLAPLPGAAEGPATQHEVLEVDLPMLRGSRVQRFLEGCGLGAEPVEEALHAAERLAARAGGALIEVRIDAAGATARVEAPHPPALPVLRPAPPEPLAAAG
jgi:hypothetical protein